MKGERSDTPSPATHDLQVPRPLFVFFFFFIFIFFPVGTTPAPPADLVHKVPPLPKS
jgi:hypothetical protein